MDDDDEFIKGIKSSDRRTQLETLRDKVAHELSVNRCKSCDALKIRASDTAALVLRLQKIMEELAAIPEKNETKSEYEQIQESVASKVSGGNVVYPFATKNAPRRQGGRRKSIKPGDE